MKYFSPFLLREVDTDEELPSVASSWDDARKEVLPMALSFGSNYRFASHMFGGALRSGSVEEVVAFACLYAHERNALVERVNARAMGLIHERTKARDEQMSWRGLSWMDYKPACFTPKERAGDGLLETLKSLDLTALRTPK